MLLNNLKRSAPLLALIVALASVTACGKKSETKLPNIANPDIDPITGEIEERLQKQSVVCDNGISCPGSLAKIVVVDRNNFRYCTGFLVNSITMATSASCLSEGLRVSTDPNRCEKDVHIFFPRSGFNASRRVKCKQILYKSTLQGKEPVLWRNDLVYFELAEPVYRRSVKLSRKGLQDNEQVTLWKVDADNDQVGVIRKQDCEVSLKSYVNPLSDSPFSPSITIVGCEFNKGNSGALVLGENGNSWKGVLSQPLSADLVRFLSNSGRLVEPLLPLVHISNSACLPSLLEADVPVEQDCFKDLDLSQIDRRRAEMLSTEVPYEVTRKEIQDEVNLIRPYFDWQADLVKDEVQSSFKIALIPKCMRPMSGWIDNVGRGTRRVTYSMTVPDWKLILGFDRGVRLVSLLNTETTQRIFVQFSPRAAWSQKEVDISVWRESTVGRTFRNIPLCD